MSWITEFARNAPCQIRVPGICNYNPETTIACHYRSVSLGAGVAIKPNDILTAHGCSACHDAIDGRVSTPFTREELRFMHAEGVLRTIAKLISMGKIGALKRGVEAA